MALLKSLRIDVPFGKIGVCSCIFFLSFSPMVHALIGDEENTIAVYDRVNASVVNITNIAVTYDFFLNPIPSQASGSGSIISKQGYILTNNHVVKNSDRLIVTLSDGSQWQAKMVGADPVSDLAVIKIDAPRDRLKVIPMGRSNHLRVGQKSWPSEILSALSEP